MQGLDDFRWRSIIGPRVFFLGGGVERTSPASGKSDQNQLSMTRRESTRGEGAELLLAIKVQRTCIPCMSGEGGGESVTWPSPPPESELRQLIGGRDKKKE